MPQLKTSQIPLRSNSFNTAGNLETYEFVKLFPCLAGTSSERHNFGNGGVAWLQIADES
jgi:hypothetical protein